MQWLNLVSEDAGIQRLRAERPVTASTGQPDAVAPYPSAHPAQLGEKPARRPAPGRERRRGERRQGDRRGQQLPVAFDTRSKHDRRDCEDRRRSGSEASLTRGATGVDVYA